ncbi:hypothetical protein HHK36_005821 [Tetracentron sinense]|uniref:protein acetyllysine N-acetyltransferase n=1 Tax=Tetracentron sinense TaxID=13715 RepID=A0A835DRD7_TETSI|nr:hypothetical protein HHK36_005821 [Tetracentron sinense]
MAGRESNEDRNQENLEALQAANNITMATREDVENLQQLAQLYTRLEQAGTLSIASFVATTSFVPLPTTQSSSKEMMFDPWEELESLRRLFIEQLAVMIQKSKHLVAFTGAGISTSCGIPDFRGPKGVWTLQREGKGVPEASLPFHRAMPSMTHMALVELEKAGILKFVISQNVDSLHLRSGIPREKLAELHGNSFREICPSCEVEYLRDFEVETIGMKETSRRCSDVKCGAKLTDTVLDWEDALPLKEMDPAEKHCKMADVVLCLGTRQQNVDDDVLSHTVQFADHSGLQPAFKISSWWGEDCNCKSSVLGMWQTPKDKKASLVIHGPVDKVIAGVMHLLNLQIPPYIRVDLLQISLAQFSRNTEKRYVKWTLRIASIHGQRAPLPFIKSVEVSFLDRPDLKEAILHKQPFRLKREMVRTRPFKMVLKLNFSDGCGCPCTRIEFPVDFEVSADSFSSDKDAVFQKLRDTAIKDSCCGQYALVERNTLLDPKSEASVYAISTNIVWHSSLVATSKAFKVIPESNGNMVKRHNECVNDIGTSPKRSKGR